MKPERDLSIQVLTGEKTDDISIEACKYLTRLGKQFLIGKSIQVIGLLAANAIFIPSLTFSKVDIICKVYFHNMTVFSRTMKTIFVNAMPMFVWCGNLC